MNRLRSFLLLIIIFCIVLLTVGCWIPESFNANIIINKDGSYTCTYDGILTFMVAAEAANKRSLSQKDEAFFEKEARENKPDGFKEFKYLGKGRYKALSEKKGKPKEPYFFLSSAIKFLSIEPQKDGSMRISTNRPSKKDIDQLKSIGAKIDGILTVSVARGVEVIKHNADSKPMLFGLLGSFKWEIKSPGDNPFIIVRPVPTSTTVNTNEGDNSLLKSKKLSKVNKHIDSREYDKILDKNDIIVISKFMRDNPSYRIASKADNHDKACLGVSKHPYILKSNLTGKEKDIIACFIDSKIKPGEYKDKKGYKRLRGQFVIVVFSPSNNNDYFPFVIEKEFPLEKGVVRTNNTNLLIQPYCESGPMISYKWEKGKFINNTASD